MVLAGPVTVTASAKMFLLQTPNLVCFWKAPVVGYAVDIAIRKETARTILNVGITALHVVYPEFPF